MNRLVLLACTGLMAASTLSAQDLTLRNPLNAQAEGGKESDSPLAVPASTPAEQKFEAALNSPVELKFTKTPLRAVVAALKDRYKIDIRLDEKALRDAGISPDVPVTADLKGVRLLSALRLVLDQLDLADIVDKGAIQITTLTAAKHLITVRYPVGDLVPNWSRDDQGFVVPHPDLAPLIRAIGLTMVVWGEGDGSASIKQESSARGPVLAITRTWDDHEVIAALLARLREAKKAAARGDDKHDPLPLFPPTAAEEKIDSVLDSPAELNFTKTPLTNVVAALKVRYKIEVQVNIREFRTGADGWVAVHVAPDMKITGSVKGTSLRSALRLLLGDYGLSCLVKNDVLLITDWGSSECRLTTVVYPVTDLVEWSRDEHGKVSPSVEGLSGLLLQGKPYFSPGADTSAFDMGLRIGNGVVLVARDGPEVHTAFTAALARLREAKRATAGGKEALGPLYVSGHGVAEAKIEAALDAPADLTFQNTPLGEAIARLKDRYKIEIRLDKNALREAGIAPDGKVNGALKGPSLRSALRFLLGGRGLAYTIEDETLLITTRDEADSKKTVVIYPLGDLAATGGGRSDDSDPLIELIHAVRPMTGNGRDLVRIVFDHTEVLSVLLTQEGHREVAALLDRLREAKHGAARGKDKYKPLPVLKPTAAEERIMAALASPMTLSLRNVPLARAVESLRNRYQIDIQLDKDGIKTWKIGADAHVTTDPKATTLRAALKSMLADTGLTCVVRGDALLVTPELVAEDWPTTVIYPVNDLAEPWRDKDGHSWADFDPLAAKIRSSICPESWEEGGPNSMTPYRLGGVEVFVISHTPEVHEKIAALLAKLRKAKPPGQQPLPLKQKPAPPVPEQAVPGGGLFWHGSLDGPASLCGGACHRGVEVLDRPAWSAAGAQERPRLGLQERRLRRGAGQARDHVAPFSVWYAAV